MTGFGIDGLAWKSAKGQKQTRRLMEIKQTAIQSLDRRLAVDFDDPATRTILNCGKRNAVEFLVAKWLHKSCRALVL
jgi:hypothetical protein